ncbi:hypothetical protein LINPERPRIM_LOCUS31460, partial [Linum perenne]
GEISCNPRLVKRVEIFFSESDFVHDSTKYPVTTWFELLA